MKGLNKEYIRWNWKKEWREYIFAFLYIGALVFPTVLWIFEASQEYIQPFGR